MKNTIILTCMVVAVALGALCLKQHETAMANQAQITSLHDELEQKTRQFEELQAAQKKSARRQEDLLGQVADLNTQIQAQKAPEQPAPAGTSTPADGSKTDTNKSGFGSMFSKMMSDPEMKKMMRQTQLQMMDQIYSPLFKQMGLTPEETDQFKNLMADNAMKGAEKAGALFSGGAATNLADASSALVAESKSNEDQIKALLGDDRYMQYTNYQQTAGERTQLNQFKMTGGSDTPLTDQQTDQLIAIMAEAKKNVAATTGQAGMSTDPGQGLQAMSSPEQLDKLLQSQDAVNQQVYENAKGVLSPDQLQSFGRFQTNQLQMMRMGMTMARKMFVPETPAAGEAAAQPGQ